VFLRLVRGTPAKKEDAFTVPDWAGSTCPACGCNHHEALFAFLPTPLLNAFVAKSSADGILAVVVTPLAVSPLVEQAPPRVCRS
jgi:hypothetical protein